MQEIIVGVEGFETKYTVSNLGNVVSLDYNHTGKPKQLKPRPKRDGYDYVHFCKDGKQIEYGVHELVARAFIPNPNNLPMVNHIDEDKKNNVVTNLEWISLKDNLNHGTRNERISKALSKSVSCYKDGKLVKTFKSLQEADANGFGKSSVWRCCHGLQQTYKGFIWKYDN